MADLTLNEFSDLGKEEIRAKLQEELNSILPGGYVKKTELISLNSPIHLLLIRRINAIFKHLLDLTKSILYSSRFLPKRS